MQPTVQPTVETLPPSAVRTTRPARSPGAARAGVSGTEPRTRTKPQATASRPELQDGVNKDGARQDGTPGRSHAGWSAKPEPLGGAWSRSVGTRFLPAMVGGKYHRRIAVVNGAECRRVSDAARCSAGQTVREETPQ